MRTHTLDGQELDRLFRQSIRVGKEAQYVVRFRDYDITAVVTLHRDW